jgi:hypothetical protein
LRRRSTIRASCSARADLALHRVDLQAHLAHARVAAGGVRGHADDEDQPAEGAEQAAVHRPTRL